MAQDRKSRGRTTITGKSLLDGQASLSKPHVESEMKTQSSRPVKAGPAHRGDRRDLNKTYTGNERHSARGNTPRKDVATRKR